MFNTNGNINDNVDNVSANAKGAVMDGDDTGVGDLVLSFSPHELPRFACSNINGSVRIVNGNIASVDS